MKQKNKNHVKIGEWGIFVHFWQKKEKKGKNWKKVHTFTNSKNKVKSVVTNWNRTL